MSRNLARFYRVAASRKKSERRRAFRPLLGPAHVANLLIISLPFLVASHIYFNFPNLSSYYAEQDKAGPSKLYLPAPSALFEVVVAQMLICYTIYLQVLSFSTRNIFSKYTASTLPATFQRPMHPAEIHTRLQPAFNFKVRHSATDFTQGPRCTHLISNSFPTLAER